MEVKLLTPAEIAMWQPSLQALVESACVKSRGRYAPEHVFAWAESGKWQIWIVLENDAISFVCGTEINSYPTGLKALAFRFGIGKGRERWQERISDVLAWGKAQGCTKFEGLFRPGWKRALSGWTHTHEFLERELT